MLQTYNNNINEVTPQDALDILIAGNQRFINGLSVNKDLLSKVKLTGKGQTPFAAILGCMDSRAPVELIFDQGIGDVFSVRIAGNIISPGVLGSLEYATAAAGAKLILILGHTSCGAIKGACDNVEMGHLTGLLEKIKPAIARETTIKENRTSQNPEFVDNVTHLNIQHSLEQVLERSDVIRNLVKEGKVGIITALYDVATGVVTFYNEEAVMPQVTNAAANHTLG